ncbi:MAG: PQQ-dependent sugar dehydrogenase [Planctomycetota bacterium]
MAMSQRGWTCALAILLASLNVATADIKLVRKYETLKFHRPTQFIVANDGSGREFVLQQTGQVLELPKAGGKVSTFLDVSSLITIENAFEEGLLCLVFHPKFKENRKFYIYYSQQEPKRSIVSELLVDGKGRPVLASERRILEIAQPFWNHNSGNMVFGPDGYLYIAVGDGGKRDDPHRLGQNLFVLNGKILRIDVNSRSGARQYSIPKDNPFAKTKGVRPEIWAYGLRNPWGIHFEAGNGRFWCADVGQDMYEEIDIIEKGGNYGWNYREGAHQFVKRKDTPPEKAKFVDPIHEYPRTEGISITGGVVYAGKKAPSLKGAYVYGDWGFGSIWALRYDGEKVTSNDKVFKREKAMESFRPSAFCVNSEGELLVLSWDGKIYQIEE